MVDRTKIKLSKHILESMLQNLTTIREHFFENYKYLKGPSITGITKNNFKDFFAYYDSLIKWQYILDSNNRDEGLKRINEVKKTHKEHTQKGETFLLFIRIIEVIFDRKSWKDDSLFDVLEVQENIIILLQFYTEKEKILEIEESPSILEMVNDKCVFSWITIKSRYYSEKLINVLPKNELDEDRNITFEMVDVTLKECLIGFSKEYTLHKNKLITFQLLEMQCQEELLFWKLLTSRSLLSISPNKKYSDSMFEYTSKLIHDGNKEYVAFGITLDRYGFNRDKEDSYRKQYKKYLKMK